MSGFESMLASYVLNSLWQVPLLFAAAWIAVRVVRGAGSAAEHRVWVGALLLESVLPAVSLLPWQRIHIAWPWHAQAASTGGAQVSVQVGAGTGFAALRLPPAVMTALAVAYVLFTVFFIARLLWQCRRLSVLMQGTRPIEVSGEAALSCARWSRRFGINRSITLVSSKEIFAPVTMGISREYVVLPTEMVSGICEYGSRYGHRPRIRARPTQRFFEESLLRILCASGELPSMSLANTATGYGDAGDGLRRDGRRDVWKSGVCTIAVTAGGLAAAGQAGQGSSRHRSFRCQHARKETYETYREEEAG